MRETQKVTRSVTPAQHFLATDRFCPLDTRFGPSEYRCAVQRLPLCCPAITAVLSSDCRCGNKLKRVRFDPISIDETPEVFHHRNFDGSPRSLWVPTLTDPPTLVLGSSQPANTIDISYLERHAITLATRRSGGGAVLVGPNELVWFDVVLPNTDPLWHHDVGRSFDWLGNAVQRALATLDLATELHSGPLTTTEWSRRICFGGLGPGELTLDGRKVVGMSQRRTRTTSRIQVAVLLTWDPERHANLLAISDHERQRAILELGAAAVGIGNGNGNGSGTPGLHHSPTDVLTAIFDELKVLDL